jgi:outer membrane protein assembly factor BamD
MRIKIIYILLLAFALSSCSEYNRILRSPDLELRFAYAKRFFEEGRYNRSIALLEDLVRFFTGTVHHEESMFLLAQSHFNSRDFVSATRVFTQYYNTFPTGQFVESAMFYSAYGMYLASPDPRLDQTNTYLAIAEFQRFIDRFPQTERAQQAINYLFELQEKLAYKELLTAQLYLNLGNFMGRNHYEAAVITAREAIRNYPFSIHLEDFQITILRARYRFATSSAPHLQPERFRLVIDEFYNYRNMFPEGQFMSEAERFHRTALARIGGGTAALAD